MGEDIRVVELDGRETPGSPALDGVSEMAREKRFGLQPSHTPNSEGSCENEGLGGQRGKDCGSSSHVDSKVCINVKMFNSAGHFLDNPSDSPNFDKDAEEEETDAASRDGSFREMKQDIDMSVDKNNHDNDDVNNNEDGESDEDIDCHVDKRGDGSKMSAAFASKEDGTIKSQNQNFSERENCNSVNLETVKTSSSLYSSTKSSSPYNAQDRESNKLSPVFSNQQQGHSHSSPQNSYQTSMLPSKIDLPNFWAFSRGAEASTSSSSNSGNPTSLLRSNLPPIPFTTASALSTLSSGSLHGSRESLGNLSHPKLILNTPSSHAGLQLLQASHAHDITAPPQHPALGRPSPISPNERDPHHAHQNSPPLSHAGSTLGSMQSMSGIDIRTALSAAAAAAANSDQALNFPASSALSLGAGLNSYGSSDPALVKNMLGLMPPFLFPPPDFGLMTAARLGRSSLPFTQSLLAASMGRSGGFLPGLEK